MCSSGRTPTTTTARRRASRSPSPRGPRREIALPRSTALRSTALHAALLVLPRLVPRIACSCGPLRGVVRMRVGAGRRADFSEPVHGRPHAQLGGENDSLTPPAPPLWVPTVSPRRCRAACRTSSRRLRATSGSRGAGQHKRTAPRCHPPSRRRQNQSPLAIRFCSADGHLVCVSALLSRPCQAAPRRPGALGGAGGAAAQHCAHRAGAPGADTRIYFKDTDTDTDTGDLPARGAPPPIALRPRCHLRCRRR